MARLLVVEDEPILRRLLGSLLNREQHEVVVAAGGEEAQALLEKQPFDLMLTDYAMGTMNGLELLRWAHERNPSMVVILLTGCDNIATAVDALKLGAFDYVPKPFKIDELLKTIHRALEYSRALQENVMLKAQLESRWQVGEFVGSSDAMQKVCEMIRRVGPTDATVLITGERGTGKESVAKAIHAASPRKDRLFLSVDCAALPKPLLESELFGHVKGAVPGADSPKAGLFETAEGGTVFLDEIDALPMDVQGRLLQVLQDRAVRRLGGTQNTPINARVLASAQTDLRERIQQGLFREDLFNRLSVISIAIAPLRDRPEDILPIAVRLIQKETPAGEKAGGISPEACRILSSYEWPGNVRELGTCIQNALLASNRGEIKPEHLPPQILAAPRKAPAAGGKSSALPGLEHALSLKAFLQRKEKDYLEQTLKRAGGDKKAAAQNLNISLADLQHKLNGQKGP
ncbi:MAG TPA: hypothetical protein DCM68_01785 [Verrucomicrobia bacterium]|nr:hypothetical protein [Verrucomicrobiota bacterium]